jgi:hypothetical protein
VIVARLANRSIARALLDVENAAPVSVSVAVATVPKVAVSLAVGADSAHTWAALRVQVGVSHVVIEVKRAAVVASAGAVTATNRAI